MKHVRYALIMLTGLLITGLAFSNTIETITVSATADTEERAISKALAQAVQQVNGVQVDIATRIEETQPQIVINWLGNMTVLEGQEINRGYSTIEAAGPIRSYRVIESTFINEKKLWKSTIEASIVKYKNIGADRSQLTKLTVAPFRSNKESFITIEGSKSSKSVAARLNRLLTEQFVQSQRFRVLDRDFWQETGTEMLITQNLGQATEDSIKLGQKLGADYILVGLINDFAIGKTDEKLYDSSQQVYTADFDITLRIIEVATSDIIWNHTVKKQFDKLELRQQLKTLRPDPFKKTEFEAALEMQDGLYEILCKTITQAIISHFYPVKVLSTDDGILLNQGGSQVVVGDIYTIYSASKTINDPDTGKPINTKGTAIARIKVSHVYDDYAQAVLVDGSLQRIKKGAIAILTPENRPAPKEDSTEPKPLTPGSSEKPLYRD